MKIGTFALLSVRAVLPALAIPCIALAFPATARNVVPLSPSAPWTVARSPLACTVTRTYGTGAERKAFGFHAGWRGLDGLLIESREGYSGPLWRADVNVVVGTHYPVVVAAQEALLPDNRWLTEIEWPHNVTVRFARARSVALQFGPTRDIAFALPDIASALTRLDACITDLQGQLGIAPHEPERVAAGPWPIAGSSRWITADDYPAAAIATSAEGKTMTLLKIGVDGSVQECRTLQSSGHPLLDQAACSLLATRGRYRPAIGHDRKPIGSHVTRLVDWRMPPDSLTDPHTPAAPASTGSPLP